MLFRSLCAAAVVFVVAFAALVIASRMAPRVGEGLTASRWALPLHVATGVAAIAAIGALWRRQYGVARVTAAAQVSLILWGWAFSQFPYVIPPSVTIRQAAAPQATLELLLAALAAGALILIPSLVYLFRTFRAVRQ